MKPLILFDEIAAFAQQKLTSYHRSPYAVQSGGERNPIGRRTQSDQTADATRLDGERNPPLKINILTTDFVVSSLLTLNFCGFRAFCGSFLKVSALLATLVHLGTSAPP